MPKMTDPTKPNIGMTEQEKVLAVWPDAVEHRVSIGMDCDSVTIHTVHGHASGSCWGPIDTRDAAWADAASKLPKSPTVEASNELRGLHQTVPHHAEGSRGTVGLPTTDPTTASEEVHLQAPEAAPVETVEAEAGAVQINAEDIIQDLLDAIPSQNNDRDWWPDELTAAVRKAKAYLDAPPAICAEPESERPMRAEFDGMSWPIPDHQTGWQIRYNPHPKPETLMRAASELDAYARLIALPIQRRNYIIRKIKEAMNGRS